MEDRKRTVREILQCEGLTYQAFANAVKPGLTAAVVWRWVHGINRPGDAYWTLIRQAFPVYFD